MESHITVFLMEKNKDGVYEAVRSVRAPRWNLPGHRAPRRCQAYVIETSGEYLPDVEKSESTALTRIE
jgi:hypothetical protein